MGKIGLILEGGGMKCAYGAGILDCFSEKSICFDYCIGVSAGSANAASFLAGQKERNLRFYTVHARDPRYLSIRNFLRTGEIFGLHYIYGEMTVSTGIDPVDFPAIAANPCEYEIVSTDAQTGKPVYFTKADLKQDDYTPIMASCAIPALCKPVPINDKLYYDGGISDAIPVRRAFDRGCDKVVVILSKPRDFVKQPEGHRSIYSRMLRKFPATIDALDHRHIMYRKCIADLKEYETAGKAFVFAPTKHMKMSTFSKDPKLERKLYDLGISDFQECYDALKKFLAE